MNRKILATPLTLGIILLSTIVTINPALAQTNNNENDNDNLPKIILGGVFDIMKEAIRQGRSSQEPDVRNEPRESPTPTYPTVPSTQLPQPPIEQSPPGYVYLAQKIQQWGMIFVPCGTGSARINLGANAVCVNPTPQLPPGDYFYNPSTNQFIPINPQPTVVPLPGLRQSSFPSY